ncbi:MAG: RNA-binding protein [Chloroflexi bacterium]|nr:RNA-binding protein [Chloroflexota bacterium]
MKIYVGNLPYEYTDTELNAAFSAHGKVDSAQIVTDRYTGRSRGFGFVEMSNNAEAETAIKALNGKELKGRPLTVNEARPREDRGGQGGMRGGNPGGRSFGGQGGSKRW